MEGCSAPLVVKFADTQKEKDAKRIQAIQSSLWNFAAGVSPVQPSFSITSPVHTNSTHSNPFLPSEPIPNTSLQLLQAIGVQQQLLHGKVCHFMLLLMLVTSQFYLFISRPWYPN
jgi:bruno